MSHLVRVILVEQCVHLDRREVKSVDKLGQFLDRHHFVSLYQLVGVLHLTRVVPDFITDVPYCDEW